jgi:NSS family neurotransmitter:Na+ symporter
MASWEQWGSRRGFILATVGAAVGLGNIWRFSYVAGENGGAAFLFLYFGFVVLIGLPLVIAELSLGRRAQSDPVTALASAGGRGAWRHAGWIGVFGAVLILSYYAVIAGWALKYFIGATTGELWALAETGYGAFFRRFIADRGEPVAWQAAMLGATMFVVTGGVRRGIEQVNRWLMPVLIAIVLALALYALSLPNSRRGVAFLFALDWSVVGEPRIYVAALGQAFFSLGVGMAVFVAYGGYMPRTFSLPLSAAVIAFADTAFAVVAGLAIFPAVFAFGVDPTAGPELAFITLPKVFLGMPAGHAIGAVFFFLLSAAAFTSMVSLLEVPVAVAVQRFRLRRWIATAIVGAAIFVLGLPSALSFGTLAHVAVGRHGLLDAIDAGVSNFLLPTAGVVSALVVGWRLRGAEALHEADLADGPLGRAWLWLVRTLVPTAIVAILLQSASAL